MNSSELQLSDVSYTKRDFQEVYVELLDLAKELAYKWDPTVSNESDPGVVLIKELALAIDKINYNSDKNALENFPLSVSQDRMARQLFSLLGYFPKWYRSAISDVNLTYSAEELDTSNPPVSITLPLFTQIKDADNDFVYTLFGDADGTPTSVTFTMDGKESPTYKAIEGTIQRLNLNGSEIIYLSNLDSDNRVYLPDYNVAQNGIFISNIVNGQPSLNFWTQVDNLYTEDLNSLVYSFGVDILNGECYVEFPQDIATLIGEGLAIYYILSTGSEGNVPIGFLDSFYDSTVVGTRSTADTDGSTTINLSADNVTISNIGLTFTGKNPETIDESYKNYKKTVGTFDTLVTLRDYNNAFYNTEEVSNCVVTDRTNDIQSTYKIISETSDLINYEYAIDGMDAFDLKVYALNYNDLLYSKGDYDLTFTMYTDRGASIDSTIDPAGHQGINSNLYQLVKLLDDQKCICHDFNDIEANKICLFKNKFTINCNIIPVASVSEIQKTEIKQNISQSIYQALNARNIEFGEKMEYDSIYRIILNSDKRIKAVMLDNIEYDTYAIYYDDGYNHSTLPPTIDSDIEAGWKEICISDQTTGYIKGYYNSSDDRMYEIYVEPYVTVLNYSSNVTVNNSTFLSQVGSEIGTYTFTYSNSAWYLDDVEVTLSDYGLNVVGTDDIVVTVGNTQGQYINPFGNSLLSVYNYYMDNITGYVYTYTVNGAFVCYSKKRNEFRTEIFAKSILAGATPYLVENGPLYQYRLNQNQQYFDNLKSVDHISTRTHKDIPFGVESTVESVELGENETVQFYRPSLFENAVYSTYVKFIMIRPNATDPLEANVDYELGTGEQIIFLYKENDSDSRYRRDAYGEGTIICPTFTMDTFSSSNQTFSVAFNSSSNKVVDYLSTTTSNLVSSSTDLQSLTSTNTIAIKAINQVSLTDNNSFYVITSDIITEGDVSKYRMTLTETSEGSGEYEYVLQTGEYFIYTNSAKTVLNILGSGTKISQQDGDVHTFTNTVVATSSINLYGVSAISSSWNTVPASGLTVTEQEFINVLPGGSITLQLDSTITPYTEASQYTFSYVFDNDGSYADNYLSMCDMTASNDITMIGAVNMNYVRAFISTQYLGDSTAVPDIVLTNPIVFTYKDEPDESGKHWTFTNNAGVLTYVGTIQLKLMQNFTGQIIDNEETFTEGVSAIQLEYSSIPQSSVDVSNFGRVSYTQPDGTTGVLNLSTSDRLKWKAKTFLTFSSSIYSPQILREGQSVTFYSNGEGTELAYDDTPVIIYSDVPVYTIGGDLVDITYLTDEGEIGFPQFYAYTESVADGVSVAQDGDLHVGIDASSGTGETTEYSIDLSLPVGEYIIPVVNRLSFSNDTDPESSSFKMQIGDGDYLHIFNGTNDNFINPGIYYVYLSIPDSNTTYTLNMTLYLAHGLESDQYLMIKPLLRFVKSEYAAAITDMDECLQSLDTNRIFDYTYRVNEEQQIDNPLDSAQFFNYYHIYNNFTIAQVDGFVIRIVS